MKGIDIVVRGSVGHMSAFMAQTGWLVVCGDAGDALGDSIYEARLYVRGAVEGARRRLRREGACATSTSPSFASLLERAGIDDVDAVGVPPLRLGAARSTTSRSTTPGRTDGRKRRRHRDWQPGLRESYLYDRNVIAEIQRAAREGIYDIRGFGAKRQRAALRRPAPPRRERLALPARGLPRALRHRRHARDASRVEAARAEDPDHDRGDELRRALGAREGGARPRCDRGRHVARRPVTAG